MGRMILRCAGLAAVLAAAAPGAVSATPRLIDRGPIVSLEGDGGRLAAWGRSDGATYLYDDRGPDRLLTPPAGCNLAGLGGGQVLWSCYAQGGEYLLLYDIGKHVVHRIAGEQTLRDGPHDEGAYFVSGVGSWWLDVTEVNHGGEGHSHYFNWQTGSWGTPPAGSHTIPDLDQASLGRHLCSPLTTALPLAADLGVFVPYDYRPPYGLRRGVYEGDSVPLLLAHCGSRRAIRLSWCQQVACRSMALGPTAAIWAEGPRLHAYMLRSRKRFSWTFNPGQGEPVNAVITGDRLFVEAYGGGTPTLFTVRLPH